MIRSRHLLAPFSTTATGAGMAGWAAGADRQSRLSGGLHPKDRNEEEEPGFARLAACRGGTRGQRRPPRYSDAGGQRHRARDVRSPSQHKRCPAPAEPTRKHPRIRSAVAAACARAWGPAVVAPSGRIERATRETKGPATPGGFAEVRQCALT